MKSSRNINVLVTGVGSNIGQGIVKALRLSRLPVHIIGTDSNHTSAGLVRCDKGCVLPRADSEDYIPELIRVCAENAADIVLAGSDPEPPVLARHAAEVENACGTKVLAGPPELVDVFHDKWATCAFIEGKGLDSPKSILPEKEGYGWKSSAAFPLVVKPRRGAGSRGVYYVEDMDDLDYALKKTGSPIVQELVGGEEYTIGLFFDRVSAFKGSIVMKRELLCGTTYRAYIGKYPEVRVHAERLGRELSKAGAVGPMNVQARYDDGRFVVIEVNPRFSGTTVFRAKFGFNEPEWALRHFVVGEDVPALKHTDGVVLRFWEEVYTTDAEIEKIRREGCVEGAGADIPRVF